MSFKVALIRPNGHTTKLVLSRVPVVGDRVHHKGINWRVIQVTLMEVTPYNTEPVAHAHVKEV